MELDEFHSRETNFEIARGVEGSSTGTKEEEDSKLAGFFFWSVSFLSLDRESAKRSVIFNFRSLFLFPLYGRKDSPQLFSFLSLSLFILVEKTVALKKSEEENEEKTEGRGVKT